MAPGIERARLMEVLAWRADDMVTLIKYGFMFRRHDADKRTRVPVKVLDLRRIIKSPRSRPWRNWSCGCLKENLVVSTLIA